MTYSKKEREVFLCGYVEAISSLKDIITPNLGGCNSFFSIPKQDNLSVRENILAYLEMQTTYYAQFSTVNQLEKIRSELQLDEIMNPESELQRELPYWCCDESLVKEFGRHGYLLSKLLLDSIRNFFKGDEYKLYEIHGNALYLPWSDMMSKDYAFETMDSIYILHLGEST